jgi:predicted small lipoprotein YifL
MTSTWRSSAALGLAALAIAGCGLKGPLRLPEETQQTVEPESGTTTPRKRSTVPAPAPQSQKEPAGQGQELPPVSPPDPDRPTDPGPEPRTRG